MRDINHPGNPSITLPSRIASPFSTSDRIGTQFRCTIEVIEQNLILTTLEKLNGDKPKAAEMLGISLKTLYKRLQDDEIETGMN